MRSAMLTQCTEPIDILEIEEGRVLSQDEEDFLDGKFQLRVDEEESKSELEALPQRVLELLRDNRHDFLEDLKWEDYDEIGLVSQVRYRPTHVLCDVRYQHVLSVLCDVSTDTAYGAIGLRAWYAMSGTDLADVAP
eukprot:1889480-Rhodomonas_salina.2